MAKSWWLSARIFTIQVDTDERGIITWTAPIAWKFRGQQLANLERWSGAKAVPLHDKNIVDKYRIPS